MSFQKPYTVYMDSCSFAFLFLRSCFKAFSSKLVVSLIMEEYWGVRMMHRVRRGIYLPYRTIPYRTLPWRAIPYHTMVCQPNCTIQYQTVPYRTKPYQTLGSLYLSPCPGPPNGTPVFLASSGTRADTQKQYI